MSTEVRPAHSPLGASGAERWMNCPGSVALLKQLKLPETDEPDYRKEGTAAHEAACKCLRENLDAWELINQEFAGVKITSEMVDAIQVYIDVCRPLMVPGAHVMIEYGISHPVHKDFYGTVDFAVILADLLEVNDYKNGAGVVVEVEWNPQIMYYAYGILKDHPEVKRVRLRIVQPNGFHPDGPVRLWEIDAATIREWAEKELLPAMDRAEMDARLDAGPWCRFCPAKLVCPLMTALFGAACQANPKTIANFSDAGLGRNYQYVAAVKSYIKAVEETALARLKTGAVIEGIKLVPKKANRVYKPGAADMFSERFGKEAMTDPELKSPAEMEKLSPGAKELVREFAYTPFSGETVALASDKRPAIVIRKAADEFPNAAAAVAAVPEE